MSNTHIPVGTGIVLDSTIAVRAWTRMGMTIQVNYYGDSDWTTNAVSFRCEERVCIGVQRPAAVCIVTGLGPS